MCIRDRADIAVNMIGKVERRRPRRQVHHVAFRRKDIHPVVEDPVSYTHLDVYKRQEQTFATIAPYTLEETYEVLDAIQREDFDDLRGELGDLLFQVVFYAQMAQEMCIRDRFHYGRI